MKTLIKWSRNRKNQTVMIQIYQLVSGLKLKILVDINKNRLAKKAIQNENTAFFFCLVSFERIHKVRVGLFPSGGFRL
jgi:hypothetical protein